MSEPQRHLPQRIKLSSEQRTQMIRAIQQFHATELDEEISHFRAVALLDFFITEVGAPIYNQAIRHAQALIADKVTALEAELYEPEQPYALAVPN